MEALGRVVCIKTWDNFKKRAVILRPRSVMYFLQWAPLSKPPLALRFLFTSENTLYMFLDCADGDVFKQTKILIKGKGGKQRYVLHGDIKEFIVEELGRRDLDVISPIFHPRDTLPHCSFKRFVEKLLKKLILLIQQSNTRFRLTQAWITILNG